MQNRLTMLLLASMLAILSGTAAADHVNVGIGIGVPVAPAPVVVAPAPAYYPPPPGYYAPGPGYVWVSGFWRGHHFHRGHWRHR